MMAVGGRSDYSVIEPYLTAPTESRIGEASEEVGPAEYVAILRIVVWFRYLTEKRACFSQWFTVAGCPHQ